MSYPAYGSIMQPMSMQMTAPQPSFAPAMPMAMSMPQVQSMPAFATQQPQAYIPTQTASMPALTNHNNGGNAAFDPSSFMAQRQALSTQPLLAPYQQQQQAQQQAQQQQQALPNQSGGDAYAALVPYQDEKQKQTSTQLAADMQHNPANDPTQAGRTREERMYLATVSELTKIIHTKYKACRSLPPNNDDRIPLRRLDSFGS